MKHDIFAYFFFISAMHVMIKNTSKIYELFKLTFPHAFKIRQTYLSIIMQKISMGIKKHRENLFKL